jgi:protein arginine kinase activator
MQRIINNVKSDIYLCPECLSEVEKPLSVQQFFQGLLNAYSEALQGVEQKQEIHSIHCPVCGLSFEDFKNSGKVGCAECYNTFRREMDVILRNIQDSNRHEGKYPQKGGAELFNRRRVNQLKLELSKAVEAEEYEEAARLRDEIRSLEVPV